MKYEIGSEEWIQRQIETARNNRANQLNPNNDAYWSSRNEHKIESDSGSSNKLALAAVAMAGVALVGVATLAFQKFFGKKEETTEICEVEPIESIELDDDIEDEQEE